MNRTGYLQGLRGLAALYVLFAHCADIADSVQHTAIPQVLSFGQIAVTLFMVISGYCLMMPVAACDFVLRDGVMGFFRRRAVRIFPPYYAALALILTASTNLLTTYIGATADTHIRTQTFSCASNRVGELLDDSTKTSGGVLLSDYNISATGGYDGSGNLLGVTSDVPAAPAYSGSTSYAYDQTNQLTQETSTRAGGYTNNYPRTYYLYDGVTPVCELNSSGAVTETNAFAGGLVSRNNGASSTFLASDLQGSISQRLDSSGYVLGSSIFDAYGTGTSTDSSTDPYSGYGGANGYYTDPETSLPLCTFRFYNPSSGRFVNRDRSGFNGGLNIYGYIRPRPFRSTTSQSKTTTLTLLESQTEASGYIMIGGATGKGAYTNY